MMNFFNEAIIIQRSFRVAPPHKSRILSAMQGVGKAPFCNGFFTGWTKMVEFYY
jgi:hypothetical protein